MKFEKGKFYVLRNGAKAECISDTVTTSPHKYCFESKGRIFLAQSNGLLYMMEDGRDVVADWIEPVIEYINVYNGTDYSTMEAANRACIGLTGRLGVIKVNYTEHTAEFIKV